MCGLNYKAFTEKWLMSWECTSFSLFVFFQSHYLSFFRPLCVFSAQGHVSIAFLCFLRFISESFSWWNKTDSSHSAVTRSTESFGTLWANVTAQTFILPLQDQQDSKVPTTGGQLSPMTRRKERSDRVWKKMEMDRHEQPERERKRSTISHRFQRQHNKTLPP